MNFDTNFIFKIGIFCFGVAGIAQTANLIINNNQFNIYSQISTIMNIIFSFSLALSFIWLLKQQQPTNSAEIEIEQEEINEALKKIAK